MTTFIYGLTDPETNQIHYIGKSNNPGRRLSNHIFNVQFYKSNPLSDWIQQLLEKEIRPGLMILEEVPENEWEEKERHYISVFKALGHPLKNRTEGGNVFGREVIMRSVRKSMKPVIQYSKRGDFIQEWESIRAASRGVNIAKSTIYSSLNTDQKTAGGFLWRFKKKNEEIPIKIEKGEYKMTYKPIIQIMEDGTEKKWKSIKHASEGLNIPRHTIYESLRKEKIVRGFHFKKDLSDPIWSHPHGKLNKKLVRYKMVLPQ